MHSKRPWYMRYVLYALLLIIASALGSTALANNNVRVVFEEASHVILEVVTRTSKVIGVTAPIRTVATTPITPSHFIIKNTANSAPVFNTIIQGADELVGCSVQGFTVARFNLCGNSDDRVVRLSGSYSSVSWEALNSTCSPNVNDDCPLTGSCYSQIATGPTYTLDASSIAASTGGEYRVVADGQTFYFKVKKSSVTQTFVKQDNVCGVPGRIQITGLSSAYEYSRDGGTTWQGPIFSNLNPGTYNILARLQNTIGTCEYPYEPIVIEEQNVTISATFTDAQCSGDTGTITVAASNVPGPYKYTLLNSSGVAQEFTAFVAANTYTFGAVGFGTYTVQVETQQCTGDPLNGILPPRQSRDTSGDLIVIGSGLSALDAATEVNSSFGCATITDVAIRLTTTGGSAPYTYTVNGGPDQPSFGSTQTNSGTTQHLVTAAGTYDFIITDSNGCSITASSSVQELLPPDVTVSGVDGTCTNAGAQLLFSVNDARGYNLSFRASSSDTWSTAPQLSVSPDTYTGVEVRYEQGSFECVLPMPTITVTTVSAIVGNATKISDVTCTGSGNTIGGQINFEGPFSGGSGSGYMFSIDGVNFFSNPSFINLAPGTYTPIISDSGGCRLVINPGITILGTNPPTDISFVQSNINCTTATTDVQLTATSSAAVTNYTIISPTTVDNGSSSTFTGLDIGTAYVFEITDANNCTYTESFSPAALSTIRARVRSGGDLRVCNNATDGTGRFIVDGFEGDYTYQINGGTVVGPQNDSEVILPASGAGTHTIVVTDALTGCTATTFLVIQEATVLDLASSIVIPMTCENNNIGRVEARVVGGWGGNTYTLQLPSGGTLGPQSNRYFGNLTEATNAADPLDVYTLFVEDNEGCTASFTFDLEQRIPPTISIAATDLCFSSTSTGAITVTSTGGGATHRYRINNGVLQTDPNFTGLVPGDYVIEVVDNRNCSSSLTVTIPPQLNAIATIVEEIPCAGDGTLGIVIGGGDTDITSTTYTIFRDANPVATHTNIAIPATSFNYTVPFGEHGNYTVQVTDANGCIAISPAVVYVEPTSITATHTFAGVSCGDTSSGFVQITPDATGGIPPFEIKFGPSGSLTYSANDDGTYAFTSQTLYSGLPVGDYEYMVRDSRGCLIPSIIAVSIGTDPIPAPNTIAEPIDALCSANEVSGGIRITGTTDGVSGFTYIITDSVGDEITRYTTDASTTYPIDILDNAIAPGQYQVLTIDSRGCSDTDQVAIAASTLSIVPDNTLLPITCSVTGFPYCIDIVGGTGPFEIRLLDGTTVPFTPLGGTLPSVVRRYCFSGMQFGEVFTIEVLDTATNCTYDEVIQIPEGPTTLDVSLAIGNATCIPGNLVGLTYTVLNSTGILDVEIRNTETGALFISESRTETSFTYQVPEGSYSILAYDNGTTCSGGATAIAVLNEPTVAIIENRNANCNADGQLTVRGSGGDGGPYEYAYVPAGTAVDTDGTLTPTDATDDFTLATTIALPGATAPGVAYDIWVRDGRNCDFRVSTAVITEDPPLPPPSFQVSNQCAVTAPTFSIVVFMPGNISTPNFTLGGVSQFGVLNLSTNLWEATFIVSSIGAYRVDVMDANGCTSFSEPEVFQVLSASGGFTTVPTCTQADGIIAVTANGGSGDFDFELQNTTGVAISSNTTGTFPGIAPGAYQVLVTDNLVTNGSVNCTYMVQNIISTVPTPVVISTIGVTDESCFGANDGSVNLTLTTDTDVDGIAAYMLYTGTYPLPPTSTPVQTGTSSTFTGLAPGNYVVRVETSKGCLTEESLTIQPANPFSITASATDFSCEPGDNRFSSSTITAAVVEVGTVGSGYQYSITGFSNFQDTPTFEIVDNGTPQNITVYAIDGNGCTAQFDIPTINPSTNITSTIIAIDALNCTSDERVRIQVAGTADFTVSVRSAYTVAPVTNTTGTNFVDLFLSNAGDYIFDITDNTEGCIYPMPMHRVAAPEVPMVTISEAKPVSCFDPGDDGAIFITVSNYTGTYNYNAYSATDVARTTPLATGSFDTANYPDTNGEAARITNLPGGNLIVDIITEEAPFCSAISNVTTIRTPSGPLGVSAQAVGNVGCSNGEGEILATAQGGWDIVPYEFRLLRSTDNGISYTEEIVAYASNNNFTQLAYGEYVVEVRDSEGCIDSVAIALAEVPQISAGIRQPQGLDCPNGNNAVLEVYDPSSGDATTAVPGATGGFENAGYNYRLLYLNGDDATDIASTSGLQNSPTFIGASGGFISAGWYAIEVSSSFDCIYVTTPYFVSPPPPTQPLLVQTRVPGCGGIGEMRISIENPDSLFTYEYLRIENDTPVGNYVAMTGTSELITGVEGITYQFDVRKTNDVSSCVALRSNGITMTNATGIDIVTNIIDHISCASEFDGRIESFVAGGVGDDEFYLYIGDPVDAYNPEPTATLYRDAQLNGTFEGLPAGVEYYVAVTSGATCMDIAGPFEITRPDPIIFEATTIDVSCNGQEDGVITISILSGGVGLIQFAKGPNFNEFFSDAATTGVYTFTDLGAGTYEILIQDENGCFEKDFITISEPEALQVDAVNMTPELCIGASNGTTAFTAAGGTPFVDIAVSDEPYYEYKLEMIAPTDEFGTASFAPYTGQTIENLQGGASYAVTVQDANGCVLTHIFEIDLGVNLEARATVAYGCEGIFPTNTVTVEVLDASLADEVLYALDPEDATDATTALASIDNVWGMLEPGEHTVYIYHENGCTISESFLISAYEPLSLTAIKTGPNTMEVSADGGFGEYEYFFNEESYGNRNVFATNESMIVNAKVVDAKGCVLEVPVPFEFTGNLGIPNFFTPDGDNLNDVWSITNREFYPEIEVKIYDRYGRVVANLTEIFGWDGTYDGKEVPTGDYWYVINANNKEQHRYVGHFTLYR